MSHFAGFPDGAVTATPVPDLFFTRVLPEIDSLAELKVTLHVLRLPTWVALEALRRDPLLLGGLKGEAGGGRAAIDDGLARGVERGTLLRATVPFADGEREVVAPNTARGRKALAALRAQADELPAPAPPPLPGTASDRPPIFGLYEQNVGLVQPLIADELRAAAELYPASWIEDAFRQAAAYNRRSWSYVRRILERWATDGRESGGQSRGGAAGSKRAPPKRRWVQTYRAGDRLPEV